MKRAVYFLSLLGLLAPLVGCGKQKVAMATVQIQEDAPVIIEDPDHPPLRLHRHFFGGDRAAFRIECENCPDGSRLEFQVRDFLPLSTRMEAILDEIGGRHAKLVAMLEETRRELVAAREAEAATEEAEEVEEPAPGTGPVEELEGLVALLEPLFENEEAARAARGEGYVYPYVDFPDASRLERDKAWKPAGDEWVSGPVKKGFKGTHLLKFTWAVRYTTPEGETLEAQLDPHIEVHGGRK